MLDCFTEDSTTAAVLRAIKAFWRKQGFSPSIRDIQDATGISSTAVVKYHIVKLAQAGRLRWTPRVARSYVVLEEERSNGLFMETLDR